MAITSVSLAHPMDGKMHKEWCEHKERECVEKAKSYRDMKLCMMDVKEQKRREDYEIRKKMLMEAAPRP